MNIVGSKGGVIQGDGKSGGIQNHFPLVGNDLIDEDFDTDPGWMQFGNSNVVAGEVVSITSGGGANALVVSFGVQTEFWAECDFIVDSLTIGTVDERFTVFGVSDGVNNVISLRVTNEAGVLRWRITYGDDAGNVTATDFSHPFSIGKRYKATLHYKQAVTTSSDDGIAEIWVDTVKILDVQTADNNSVDGEFLTVGTGSSGASASGTVRNDNVRVGTIGASP